MTNMEPAPTEYRYYGGLEPQPVGALSIAAMATVGLVALADVVEAVAGLRGQILLEALFSLIKVVALIVAGVMFVVWLWRARTNVEAIAGVQTQRHDKGWGIGGWICPIVNFWFPYQYMLDVWRASGAGRDRRDGLVLAWWLTFVAARLVEYFATVYVAGINQSAVVVGNALDVAAAVLVVLVVKQISDWQTAAVRPA